MQHFGLFAVLEVLAEQDVVDYLVAMNDWSAAEARDHLADTQGTWRERSAHEWRINTDAIALTVDDALLERAAERQHR